MMKLFALPNVVPRLSKLHSMQAIVILRMSLLVITCAVLRLGNCSHSQNLRDLTGREGFVLFRLTALRTPNPKSPKP